MNGGIRWLLLLCLGTLVALLSSCGGGSSSSDPIITDDNSSAEATPYFRVLPGIDLGLGTFDQPNPISSANARAVNGLCAFLTDSNHEKKPYVFKNGEPILLADVAVGEPYSFSKVGGELFFVASDGSNAMELWVTDGTPSGTRAVQKENTSSTYAYNPTELTEFKEKLFFSAHNNLTGTEVYVSDGTDEGTFLLINLLPEGSSAPMGFTVSGGQLFFFARKFHHGYELHVTDGTAENTTMVKDIDPHNTSMPIPYHLAPMGNRVFFAANDADGPGIWKSDGTSDGTQKLFEFDTEVSPHSVQVIALGSRILIHAPDSYGDSLWLSNGMPSGSKKLTEAYLLLSHPSDFVGYKNKIYFKNCDTLWVTDGTSEGTYEVSDVKIVAGYDPDPALFVYRSLLYFRGDDGINGEELWVSDGTTEGTYILKDINPIGSSYPREFIDDNGHLYFHADDGIYEDSLYVTNGTDNGTQSVYDGVPVPGTPPDGLFFFGTNGVVSGANYYNAGELTFLAEVSPFIVSEMVPITENNGLVYFLGTKLPYGRTLWRSNGTSDGTYSLGLKGISIGAEMNGKYYHNNTGLSAGSELWVTDGTRGGSRMVRDINIPGSSSPGGFINFNDKIFFSANDDVLGNELWVTDGLTTGTKLFKDINKDSFFDITGLSNSNPGYFKEYRDKLYFFADDGINGYELWSSDGTPEGTSMLADLDQYNPGETVAYQPVMTVWNDMLFIPANYLWVISGDSLPIKMQPTGQLNRVKEIGILNGKLHALSNEKLWVTDGTDSGTSIVINNFTLYDFPYDAEGPHFYFNANDGVNGFEPWISDGTPAGTFMLRNINRLPSESSVTSAGSSITYQSYNGKVYFSADDGVHGRELWVTDGTEAGTEMVMDYWPGDDASDGVSDNCEIVRLP